MSGETRYIPVNQWPHPYPTLGGLRWLIFKNLDGFRDACIKQVGRRVLIDEAAFFAWMARRGSGQVPAVADGPDCDVVAFEARGPAFGGLQR